ncbi:MAG: TonB-dependent receptor plug domain-containing protein, partial [Oligoflexales bacterium]|nr:TonB-dependent receptor plug domain-containing protein [Oligoflexales bacterium]
MAKILFIMFFWLFSLVASAIENQTQVAGTAKSELSLEDLMNLTVSVASLTDLKERESPGIVTVITEEDIAGSGARDLVDVLMNVPGFSFGFDVQGVDGLAVRGNWVHEGKFLLLWNGFEMNDMLYACTPLGNRFPVEQIKRIEIIRGPGSAIYGGFAELAVVNIITKGAEDLKGLDFKVHNGLTDSVYTGGSLNIQAGKKTDDLSVRSAAYLGSTMRSDQTYTDFSGFSYSMQDASRIKEMLFGLDLSFKRLESKFLAERYVVQSQDFFAKAAPGPRDLFFDTLAFRVKYRQPIAATFSLTPELSYTFNRPWFANETRDREISESVFVVDGEETTPYAGFSSDRSARRLRIGARADYDYLDFFNFIAGID